MAQGALKDFYEDQKGQTFRSKSLGAIERGIMQTRFQPTPQVQKNHMITVDVKCNYAKDRTLVLAGGELILQINKDGIAKVPVHQLPLLRQIQHARPGRFTIVEAPEAHAKPVPAQEPAPVQEPVVVVQNEVIYKTEEKSDTVMAKKLIKKAKKLFSSSSEDNKE